MLQIALAVAAAGGIAKASTPGQQESGNRPSRSTESRKVDFAHDIVPLLKARCAACHTNGKYKGSLSMDTREDLLKARAAVPGRSAASELFKRITSKDPDERMPSKGPALSAKEVALVKAWIDQGLAWEPGFTFKITAYVALLKPRRLTLPPARPGLEHPIDRLLHAYYARHKIQPPAPADDVTLVRRTYLDVIGQLPASAEVDAFINDAAPDKRAKLAQRLLAERRAFAEHWLTFWNDLLRNDYAGTGYIDGGRKQISAWLYRSLLANKPYDRFVRELISPTPESEGFINGIQWRGNVNASQVRELQFSQNVSLVFFGVNMKCASCHDSFIDSWKLNDAYGLAAVVADRPLEVHRCDKPLGRKASPRFLWPELGDIDPALPKARRLEQLAKLVTHPDNGRFTRSIANRLWHRLMGRGLVHPVDIMANRPWDEDLLDYLAVYLADNGYDLKKLLEHILTSKAYQAHAALVAKEPVGQDYRFLGPELKRLTAEQFLDAVWQLTGTAPARADAPVQLPPFDSSVPKERQLIRAALVRANLLMRSLGRPNREQVVTTRGDVLTTLEALDLSNGQILADYLSRGAANLLRAHPKATPEQLIEDIYRRALCRRPTQQEMSAAVQLVGSPMTADGVADLLWCVVMLPEFQLVR
jgi:hypothetical protein